MSDNINSMNYKQLRNEVQLLRDELAIMKRKYEDIIYNLDTDNFSSRFVKEQGDMRTAIKVTAEGIETKVSNEEFESTKTQLAEKIESDVKNLDDTLSTKITQTADAIKSHAYASADLSSALEISDISKATDITKTYYIKDGNGNKTYYYYNEISKDWEEIIGGGIDTVFEQTATGFKLKGNVEVDGSCILTDSLTFDSSDNPLQVEYSVDGINNWHSTFASGSDKFMRLKIGARWSDAMKIVGDNGQNGLNGTNGTNATVTATDIFNFLTNHGTNQGIFAAFVNNNNQLYINAEYLATKIADVADCIYIGDPDDNNQKEIKFASGAKIWTYKDYTGNPPTGLAITASTLDLSECTNINWGSHAVGGGTVVAVFG